MTFGSISRYSPMPPHMPAIHRSDVERDNFFMITPGQIFSRLRNRCFPGGRGIPEPTGSAGCRAGGTALPPPGAGLPGRGTGVAAAADPLKTLPEVFEEHRSPALRRGAVIHHALELRACDLALELRCKIAVDERSKTPYIV